MPRGRAAGGATHPSFEILPQLATGGSGSADPLDGKNSIVFDTMAPGLGPEVLASTSVAKGPDGHIIDADIEINATSPDIIWANLDPSAPPSKNAQLRFDLQSVMTHEFGHLLGLAHTCVGSDSTLGGDGDSPPAGSKDDAGQSIPDCSDPADSTNAIQAEAVMWYVIDRESTIKRFLTADDTRGVCAIYPPARNPPVCTQNLPDDGCGCAAAGVQTGNLAGFVVVATALAMRRRRAPHCS